MWWLLFFKKNAFPSVPTPSTSGSIHLALEWNKFTHPYPKQITAVRSGVPVFWHSLWARNFCLQAAEWVFLLYSYPSGFNWHQYSKKSQKLSHTQNDPGHSLSVDLRNLARELNKREKQIGVAEPGEQISSHSGTLIIPRDSARMKWSMRRGRVSFPGCSAPVYFLPYFLLAWSRAAVLFYADPPCWMKCLRCRILFYPP